MAIHSNGMENKTNNVYVLFEKYSQEVVGVYKSKEKAMKVGKERFIPHKQVHIVFEADLEE
jgi:hypothetical protein